jgi:uracil-DNA glycosylase
LNDPFFKGSCFERSSRRERPWREASASIVWETLGTLPFPPLMWATVPFHPHKPDVPLSNRAPTQPVRQQGFEFFLKLRRIFPEAGIVAAGRIAEEALVKAGMPHTQVRHPSHGGKADFQIGLRAAVKKCEESKRA